MSAVAVSPVRRESCDQGAEPPPPLRREALIYCPRRCRGERTGSRRSPGPRGRGARRRLEVRRAEKPGESAPGSRRGSAGGTERGGRRRVPAHPAARAPPKAGAPRPLPQSWGRQKSPGNGGKKQEKGGTRARGPPQTRKPLGAVQSPSAQPARGTAATLGLPSPAESLEGLTSSPDPTPQPPVPSAGWESSGVPLCQGYPRRPKSQCRASGEGRHSVSYRRHPIPWAPSRPKSVGKGRGLLTETGERKSALGGARLPSGDPGTHREGLCVAKFKLALRERLAVTAECCSSGRF